MKKITIAAILAIALLLTACGSTNVNSAPHASEAPASEAPAEAPQTEAPVSEAPAEAPSEVQPEDIFAKFKTEYMDGGEVDESIFAGHEIVMLNFWEPWCSPCVAELPALQQLSENYADKGFLLVGVYSTEDGAADIIREKGVTYPIIKYTDDMAIFQTGYVPTTFFFDGEGRYLAGPYVGGGDYEYWSEQLEALYEK